MVRILVGTLVEVGRGERETESIPSLFGMKAGGRGLPGSGAGTVPDGGSVLNIQIFGKSKCFDTRGGTLLQEWRIPFSIHRPENIWHVRQVIRQCSPAVGGIDNLIDWTVEIPGHHPHEVHGRPACEGRQGFRNNPALMKTPVVRNGKQATVGYCPEVWAAWNKHNRSRKRFSKNGEPAFLSFPIFSCSFNKKWYARRTK